MSTYRGGNMVSLKCLQCDCASWRYQPGEGPSRGLLHYCENLRLKLYTLRPSLASLAAQHSTDMPEGPDPITHSLLFAIVEINDPLSLEWARKATIRISTTYRKICQTLIQYLARIRLKSYLRHDGVCYQATKNYGKN